MSSTPSNDNQDSNSFPKADLPLHLEIFYESIHQIIETTQQQIEDLTSRVSNQSKAIQIIENWNSGQDAKLKNIAAHLASLDQQITDLEETMHYHLYDSGHPDPVKPSHIPGQEIGDPGA